MHSRSRHSIWPLRRHDLISVEPGCWRSIIEAHHSLTSEPLVSEWARNRWPLITRRPTVEEASGVSVGLPLPPAAGKKRLSFVVQPDQICSFSLPPALASVTGKAPVEWRPTIRALNKLSSRHHLNARVFGSLGWTVITGLDYLTASSDLDLLLHVHADTDLHRVVDSLVRIEATSPVKLDGEFVRDDGAAANWREFLDPPRQILIKSLHRPTLLDSKAFLTEGWSL